MTEPSVTLIKHVNQRIEFLDDHDPQDFQSITEMLQVFSRWLVDVEKEAV